MNQQTESKFSAIEKTLEILLKFADVDAEVGTQELSQLTGIHKATVSRILGTLCNYGMVSQNYETKKYYLGPMAYRLGRSRSSQFISAFASLSQKYIDQLRDVVKDTVSLEIWTENKTVVCYRAESTEPLRVAMTPADVLPLHAPAGAKAILSHVGEEQVKRLLPLNLVKYTDRTIACRDVLLDRLVDYNKQGYAIDDQELHPGIYAVGVAIFDGIRKPIAAVSVVMPASRVSADRKDMIVQHLKATSRAISKAINESGMALL